MAGKSKSISVMGKYYPSKEEMDAAYHCFKQGIGVYPKQVRNGMNLWSILIEIGGKSKEDPNRYPPIKVWEKVYEYKMYYYNKSLKK